MSILKKRFSFPVKLNRNLLLLIPALGNRRVVMDFMEVSRTIFLAIIGFDPVSIGILISLATVVGAVRSGVIGLLADKYGKRVFLILGGLFSAIRMLLFAFSTDFYVIALAQGLGAFGEGAGAGQPSVSGLIADNTETNERTDVFTLFAFTNALTSTIGALSAGAPDFLQQFGIDILSGYRIMFVQCALMSLGSSIIIFFIKETKNLTLRRKSIWPKKSVPVITRFSICRAVGGFGFGILNPLMPLWFYLRFGVGGEVIGLIYALSRLLSMFSYLIVTRFANRVGEIGGLVLSRIITSATAIMIPLLPSYELSLICLVLFRVTFLFTMPIRQSFITKIVDPSERSTAVGLSNLSRMSVLSAAPTIGGYLIQSVSMVMPFTIGSAVIIVNGLLYFVFFRRISKH